MKLVPLTKGQFSFVDDEDYELLMRYSWQAFWDWHTKSFYARAYDKETGGQIRMNRLLLGLKPGDKRHGEHKDGNTLNNQRSNLRIATVAENNRNRRTPKNNTSGCTGVHRAGDRAWIVRFIVKGKRQTFGHFFDLEAAKKRANEVRLELHGEFARVG